MNCYACLFEAKSIQDYILRSGRLRHIVGASELIDSLTGDLLDQVLAALHSHDPKTARFSRRAGGAVYLFTGDRRLRDAFRDLWTLTVRQYAPGLEFIIALGEGTTDYAAYQQAKEGLQSARNRQSPAFPTGTPVTRYAPRTGLPAVARDGKLGLQDAATQRFGLRDFWQRGGLTKRFAPDSLANEWPRDLEYGPDPDGVDFPFLRDNRYLGLLHADGNGLGQLLMQLGKHVEAHPDTFIDLFRDVSTAIERATQDAAQEATTQVLLPARTKASDIAALDAFPARPIVLGGDDLTILVRADLALPFARAFLEAFEQNSRKQLVSLRKKFPNVPSLPATLTAGAGIVFVKSNHPFYMAHELVESLAKFAKDRAKEHKEFVQGGERIPPTIAFYRVTTSSHGDYQDIRTQEMTFGSAEGPIITTLGAYSIDLQSPELPTLNDLKELADLLGDETMARGPARQILTLIGQNPADARRRYARWREVMKDRDAKALAQLDNVLGRLCGTLDEDLPVVSGDGKLRTTPLGDVAILLAVTKGAPDSATVGTEKAP